MKTRNTVLTTILVVSGSLGLVFVTQAVNPPPDGAYPGYNTAEGQNALFELTSGLWNSALGAFTLYGNTSGSGNTAVGINGLRNNVTGGLNTAVGLDALFANNGDPTVHQGSNNCAVGGLRYSPTRLATTTPPMGRSLCLPTTSALATRPSGARCSRGILQAEATLRLVKPRSTRIRQAASILL
jgi:hypothetical protein